MYDVVFCCKFVIPIYMFVRLLVRTRACAAFCGWLISRDCKYPQLARSLARCVCRRYFI